MFFINQTLVRRRNTWKYARVGLSLAARSQIRRSFGTSAEEDEFRDAYDLSDSCIRGYSDDQLDRDDERCFADAAYKRWSKATELSNFYHRSLHTQSRSKGQTLLIPCTVKDVHEHGYHLWLDRDVALAHDVYRQVGKDIICNAICRLLNDMIGFCIRLNPFCYDMIEDLKICRSSVSLIQVVKRRLTELFPPISGPNMKIRDDFIDEVNKMVEANGKMEENLKMLWNLLEHPLLHSIEWRSSFICQTFDRYRNYGHEIIVEGFPDRDWRFAYNEVVVKKDAHRLEGKTHIFIPDNFKKERLRMAARLNYIRDNFIKHRLERNSRVGHFFMFRHGTIHINEHITKKIDEEVVAKNLHYHLGLVALDCKDFHMACVDRVDQLDAIPCIMESLLCDA